MNYGKSLLPSTVGFDRLLSTLDEMDQLLTRPSYPPYNILKISDTQYEIEIAVAGFKREDLNVELLEGKLYVTGSHGDTDTREYFHKGIAARNFSLSYTLADTVVIKSAKAEDGILRITLENIIPEEKRSRKIDIS